MQPAYHTNVISNSINLYSKYDKILELLDIRFMHFKLIPDCFNNKFINAFSYNVNPSIHLHTLYPPPPPPHTFQQVATLKGITHRRRESKCKVHTLHGSCSYSISHNKMACLRVDTKVN